MVNAMAERLEIDTPDGRLQYEAIEGAEETLRRPEGAPVLWLTAEQSNSSLVVDDAVMLKIFRRLVPGMHPEPEMSRYLTLNGFANTPALLGELTRIADDDQRSSLAVAQAFIRNQGDAWRWTLDQFNRALEELSARTDGPEQCEDNFADYTAIVAAIGKRLRGMHAVLGRPTDDPAFQPRTATEGDSDAWLDRAGNLLEHALDALEEKTWEDEVLQSRSRMLLSQRHELGIALRTLARSGIGTPIMRVHGDFHLGQVLVTSGDVFIIDFEGEPGQPIDTRRAKSSPLRDVAGLMRSLDYAAAAALDPNNIAAAALSAEDREAFLTRLRDCAQQAFLNAYFGPDKSRNDALLDFFLIEKAAYELGYEAANRPAWLPIPLNGLLRIAQRVLRDPGFGA
jgi:maltose alpha-D-glucosyltransferase/alpha-amylase